MLGDARRKFAGAALVAVLVGYVFFGRSRPHHGYSTEPNYDAMKATLRHQDEKIAMLEA